MKCSRSCLGAKSGRKTRYHGRDLKLYHLANHLGRVVHWDISQACCVLSSFLLDTLLDRTANTVQACHLPNCSLLGSSTYCCDVLFISEFYAVLY